MKYRRPSRLRRVAKWVGLGVCVLILSVWIASGFWVAEIGPPRCSVFVERGLLFLYWQDKSLAYHGGALAPFWLLFIAAAIPTAILWDRDRRAIPPGQCLHCGYNLTGNKSGVCPECATPVPKEANTA